VRDAGKLNRGTSVIDSLSLLKGGDEELSDEDVIRACALGWCIEWVNKRLTHTSADAAAICLSVTKQTTKKKKTHKTMLFVLCFDVAHKTANNSFFCLLIINVCVFFS
jgi:hypothetical protein